MDHIARAIGMELPSLTARAAVMRCSGRTSVEDESVAWNSVLVSFDKIRSHWKCKELETDDETASTVSSDDSYSSSIASQVAFAPQLVTEVHLRPMTTRAEKKKLYYTEREYKRFRREYFEFKLRGSSLVYFADEIVTEVHEYVQEGRKGDLYYNENDLRSFLDDFVASLNE